MLTADTSVVVASIATWHEHHDRALDALSQVRALPAHVLLEAASVLSRLPHGLAQPTSVAAELLGESFPEEPLSLPGGEYWVLLDALSEAGIRGGAVYDGLIAMTACHHDATLLSLDHRAATTYHLLNAEVRWVGAG